MLKRSKIKIHIEKGNLFFFDNADSYESIYSSFIARKESTKNIIPIEFEFSGDYENYIIEYLLAIKYINYDKCNMLTHKNSKFLFHN